MNMSLLFQLMFHIFYSKFDFFIYKMILVISYYFLKIKEQWITDLFILRSMYIYIQTKALRNSQDFENGTY